MAEATISLDSISNNKVAVNDAKGALADKADRSTRPAQDQELILKSKPTSMGCFGTKEHDHHDHNCDKEEIKYIIRPQKIKIAEVNSSQYGWIKLSFRVVFIASLLLVIRTTHCRQVAYLLFVRWCSAALWFSTGLRSLIIQTKLLKTLLLTM